MKAGKNHGLDERLLRLTIRGLLREADLSAKPLALVQRLIELNRELKAIGLDVEVGLARHNARGMDEILFALRSTAPAASGKWSSIASEGHMRRLGVAQVVLRFADVDRKGEVIDLVERSSDLIVSEMPYGRIRFRPARDSQDGPCAAAWPIAVTLDTRSGWGPLLYDLAIERATELGGGLTSDRTSVSSDAHGVWDKYDSARPDVEKVQLDSLDGELTPDIPSDDCNQTAASSDGWRSGGTWRDSPLSRAFRKSGSGVTAALRQADLLWE
jgi:hypothetical protein